MISGALIATTTQVSGFTAEQKTRRLRSIQVIGIGAQSGQLSFAGKMSTRADKGARLAPLSEGRRPPLPPAMAGSVFSWRAPRHGRGSRGPGTNRHDTTSKANRN